MSALSADKRVPKRLQDFDPSARSQKQICVSPDRGYTPSLYHDLPDIRPRPPVDVINSLTSDAQTFSGESKDIDMSDDNTQLPPFANPGPMDIDDEIVDGIEANTQKICYGAVRHMTSHEAVIPSMKING